MEVTDAVFSGVRHECACDRGRGGHDLHEYGHSAHEGGRGRDRVVPLHTCRVSSAPIESFARVVHRGYGWRESPGSIVLAPVVATLRVAQD